MKARIAITSWLRPIQLFKDYQADFYILDPAYVECVKRAGGIPFIVPLAGDAKAVLEEADGLLIIGGDDIDPTLYGAVNEGDSKHVNPEMDRWELELIGEAEKLRMPVLGVCRGMQLISIACGGRMEQEVARLDLVDHPDLSSMGTEEVYALRHEVEIVPGSRLASLAGQSTVTVNNIHHQIVVDPGTLKVSARSKDGVIEAVETEDDWPVLGVQWHPEKLSGTLSERIFADFVHKAKSYRTKMTETRESV